MSETLNHVITAQKTRAFDICDSPDLLCIRDPFLREYLNIYIATVPSLLQYWNKKCSPLLIVSEDAPLTGVGSFYLFTVRAWRSMYLSLPYLSGVLGDWEDDPQKIVSHAYNKEMYFAGDMHSLAVLNACEETHHLVHPELPANIYHSYRQAGSVATYDAQDAEYYALIAQQQSCDYFGLVPEAQSCINERIHRADLVRQSNEEVNSIYM